MRLEQTTTLKKQILNPETRKTLASTLGNLNVSLIDFKLQELLLKDFLLLKPTCFDSFDLKLVKRVVLKLLLKNSNPNIIYSVKHSDLLEPTLVSLLDSFFDQTYILHSGQHYHHTLATNILLLLSKNVIYPLHNLHYYLSCPINDTRTRGLIVAESISSFTKPIDFQLPLSDLVISLRKIFNPEYTVPPTILKEIVVQDTRDSDDEDDDLVPLPMHEKDTSNKPPLYFQLI